MILIKPGWQLFFYRTSLGDGQTWRQKVERDSNRNTRNPPLCNSLKVATETVKPDHAFVIATIHGNHPLKEKVTACSLTDFLSNETCYFIAFLF
jgi:hypothetical protein